MALDPSISLEVRPPQFNLQIPQPLQQFGQVLSLQNLMQTGQMTNLELQLKRMQLQEALGVSRLLTNPTNPSVTTTSPTIQAPSATTTTPTLSNFMLGPPVTSLGIPSGVIPLPAPAASAGPAAAPSDTTGQPTPAISSVTGQPAAPPTSLMDRPLFGNPGYPTARQILTVAPTTGLGFIENANKVYKSQLDTELAGLNLHKGNSEALARLLNGVTDDESLKRALPIAVQNGWMDGGEAGRFTSLGFNDPYVQKRLEEAKQQSLNYKDAVTTAIAKNTELRNQIKFPFELTEQTGKAQQAELQSALSALTPAIQRSPTEFTTKLGNTDPQAGSVYSPYVQSVLGGSQTSGELAKRGLTAQQTLQQQLEQAKFEFEKQQKDPLNLFGLNPPTGAPAPTAGTAQGGAATQGTIVDTGQMVQVPTQGGGTEMKPDLRIVPPGYTLVNESGQIKLVPQNQAKPGTQIGQPVAITPDGAVAPSSQPAPSIQALIRDPNLHGQPLLDQLNQLSPALASQVKAISEGRQDFPNVRALATAPGQTLAALVAQYDPSFDVKNPAIRQATSKAFTSGEEASRVTALNNSVSLLNDLALAADRLGNTAYPFKNLLGNFLNTQKGYPEVKDFNAAKTALLSQLPTAVKGDMKVWEDAINSSDSPEQLHRVLARMANTIETNLNQLQAQERSGMGTTIDRPPLTSPASRQTLDRVKSLATGKNPNPGGYTPGHVYGGMTYLGGDVNQRSSWK